ncbi:MAG: SPASM domain-containing protein [Phycisphaeraceae bacterium]|nr:SPASM domain-containing protein [Phycisphaeraceae bacterium]
MFRAQGERVMLSLDHARVIEITDDRLLHILGQWEQQPQDTGLNPWQMVDQTNWPEEVKEEIKQSLHDLAPYTVRTAGMLPYMPDVAEFNKNTIRISSITLMVSEACNLRCRYCYTGLQVDAHSTRLMSEEIAHQAIEMEISYMSPEAPAIRATFFGGEPLLNFDVVRSTIEYVKRRAKETGRVYSFTLTTNGVLLTEPIARYLHENKCSILLSIDGPAWIHDEHRIYPNGKGCHAQVVEAANLIRRVTGALNIRATQTPGGPTLRELCRYFYELGATPPYLIGPVMDTKANGDGSVPFDFSDSLRRNVMEADEIRPLCLQDLIAGRTPLYDIYSFGFKRLNCRTPMRHQQHCSACTSGTAVGADGTLYPCHRFWPMTGYALGNVRTGFDIQAYSTYFSRYHQAVTSHCQDCWARFLCLGGCYRFRATEDGQFRPPAKAECDSIRHSWERTVSSFLKMSKENPDILKRICGQEDPNVEPCMNPGSAAASVAPVNDRPQGLR